MLTILRMHISERATKYSVRPIATICDVLDWATDLPDHWCNCRDSFAVSARCSPTRCVALTMDQTLAILLF